MPSDSLFLPHLLLKINGANAPAAMLDDMLDCTVENSIHLPDVCTIRIYDENFRWVDEANFSIGKAVEVQIEPSVEPQGNREPSFVTVFNGEITALEMDMTAEGVTSLLVRCYDRSHRLHRGRYRRSFMNVTDTDIVKKIAPEAGLTADAESTAIVHKYVFQNNQTNWEFLAERAARNGFRLYLDGARSLKFKKVIDNGTGEVTMDWGKDLRSFRPRLSASPQVNKVTVRGWDPIQKQAIIGESTTPNGTPRIGFGKKGGPAAQQGFAQTADMVVVDKPVHSQKEAESIARSVFDDISGEFVEADGLCYGRPDVLPGKVVNITNIGTRFSGKYLITATTHVYAPSEGYSTMFSVSGKRPETLLSMIEHDGAGKRAPLGGNIVVGLVTNNRDTENLGRVKVKFPWMADNEESDWARIAAPMAGPSRGFYFLPEINDEVLVAFEHGDIRRPFLLGALWNGKDKPIENNSVAVGSDGKVNHRIIKTRVGHTILLDDTGSGTSSGEIKLTTAAGHVLTLDDTHKKIEAKTTSGHKITLDDQGQQIIVVDKNTTNKMTIKSTDNSITLECMGNFTVDAKGKVSIQGAMGVDVKTPAMMNLEATGPAALKSTAILTVQGTLVKIN